MEHHGFHLKDLPGDPSKNRKDLVVVEDFSRDALIMQPTVDFEPEASRFILFDLLIAEAQEWRPVGLIKLLELIRFLIVITLILVFLEHNFCGETLEIVAHIFAFNSHLFVPYAGLDA